MLWTLIKHECRLQAIPKQTWIILCGLHLLLANLFYGLLVQFEDKMQSQLIAKTAHYGITEDAIHPYLAWSLLLMILCIPICNTNNLSHEQKYRTLNLYRMASVPMHQVVFAKFLSTWLFWILVISSLSLLPLSLQFFGKVDTGQLFSGLLGLCLIAGSIQAMTLLFTAYCRQPLYAILLTFTALLTLSFLEWLAPYANYGSRWLQQAGFLYHIKHLLNGLVNTIDIAYYLGIIAFGLLMAIQKLLPRTWKNTVTAVAIGIGILGILTAIYSKPIEKDYSVNRLNSLQEDTKRLLKTLNSPLTFSVNLDKKHPYFEDIEALLHHARRISHWVTIVYIDNPTPLPAGNLSATIEITYQDSKKIIDLTQSRFTEASLYQVIYPFLHHKDHWLLFTQGHGERSIYHPDPKSYTHLFALLTENGSSISAITLQETGFIPDNTQILVLSPNALPFLPGEVRLIENYLNKGGNLLWLLDEQSEKDSLSPLFAQLGIRTSDTVLAPNHPGVRNPYIGFTSQYPDHPMTATLESLAIFPYSIAIYATQTHSAGGWKATPLLTVKQHQTVFPIGVALERSHPSSQSAQDSATKTQRVMVVGNGQFLANGTILQYANRELGQRIIDWLADNDNNSHLIPKPAIDDYFVFPTYSQTLYQIAYPVGLMLVCWGLGFGFHRRRINKFY